jgi:hypothetical protein
MRQSVDWMSLTVKRDCGLGHLLGAGRRHLGPHDSPNPKFGGGDPQLPGLTPMVTIWLAAYGRL